MSGAKSPPLRVFVSSTYFDNVDRREGVRGVIQRAEMLPIGMESWSAASQPVIDECLAKVRSCQLFVCILAYRYGYEPAGVGCSLTELEFEEARKHGIPCLAFLIDEESVAALPNVDFDPGPERWKKQERLDGFKKRLRDDPGLTVVPFRNENLNELVLQALHEHARRERDVNDSKAKTRADAKAKRSPARGPKKLPLADSELATYLEQLVGEHQSIELAGFETRVRVPIRLEDLYVPVQASLDLAVSGGFEFGDAGESESALRDRAVKVSLAEAFGRARKHARQGLVLLGDPGSGKTTQLKRLLLSLAKHGPESLELPAGTTPIWLPLRELPRAKGDLLELLRLRLDDCAPRLESGFAQRLLKRGQLLFLVDGLDEVPVAKDRERVARAIEKLLEQYPKSFAAVSCRYAGYKAKARLGAQFLELHLHPFTREQSEEFIQRWFELVETSLAGDVIAARRKARERAEELVEHLRRPEFRSQRILEMTRNPLLLTAVCLVHRDRARLPERRAALYEECVKVLLELWRDSKKLHNGLDAERARRVLQPMALYLHEREQTRATAEELEPVLTRALKEIEWEGGDAATFLAAIRDESGLLTGWSGDTFGFMHLGFQEYLAAHEIRTRVLEELTSKKLQVLLKKKGRPTQLETLTRRFGQSWWQEATLLFLSLEAMAEPFWRELLRRDSFPAASPFLDLCLTEPPQFAPHPFLECLEDAEPARARWDHQLGCLRALQLRKAKLPESLEDRLRAHPDPRIRELRGGVASTGGLALGAPSLRGRGFVANAIVAGCPMVELPGGTFAMGSSDEEAARLKKEFRNIRPEFFDTERPRHSVRVSRFQLAITPVTNEQYARFLKENPGAVEPEKWSDRRHNQPRQPVVGISWDEANAFCRWAGLRLPTEAEWEYACRAGSMHERYSSGNSEDYLGRVGWYAGNSSGELHAVAEKPANEFGLHDMHGNVWEWCEDTWHPNYERAPVDGRAWVDEASGYRVSRGGSFGDSAEGARSACRFWHPPSDRWRGLGFRPARSVTTD
jgi:formylglycine-generating enzyme required for sulfatase activity